MLKDKVWCPVRSDAGREWVDICAASACLSEAQRKARELYQKIPQYCKAQPVVRYAQFELTEIEEGN